MLEAGGRFVDIKMKEWGDWSQNTDLSRYNYRSRHLAKQASFVRPILTR